MGPFEMVVAIVAIVTIGKIIHGRHKNGQDWKGNPVGRIGQDEARLREDIRALKERVAVLERLATDDSSSLEREIEKLREKDMA